MATTKTTKNPKAANAIAAETKPEETFLCGACVYCYDRAAGKARCSKTNSPVKASDTACTSGERKQ